MLFTGVLILVGAVAMTKFRRVYEAAILKTLGASTRARRHACCSSSTACSGCSPARSARCGGVALSWAISRYAIEIPWRSRRSLDIAVGVVVTTVLVAAVGVAASLDVLRRKPLATLRAE